ncbi:MAG: elongation factor P [Patescibacteria group bacterium]
MAGINDLKKGFVISINNQPYQVVFSQHVKMGRGGAVMRTKLKNLVTGAHLEQTFKTSDKPEEADLTHGKANFLYSDEKALYFMNNDNYDQFSLDKTVIGDKEKYLKEGSDVDVLLFNDQAVNIELPKKVELKVTSAPDGVRGDSAQGSVTKEVELENNTTIKTPLFIKTGDMIRVNTDTGEYVERA